MKETLDPRALKAWLRQPDDRDLVPVRGVVMHLAAEEIERLEREIARLSKEMAATTAPDRITFQDGDRARTLIRGDEGGYALPEGAETLADIRLAAFAEGAASVSGDSKDDGNGGGDGGGGDDGGGEQPPAGQDAEETARVDGKKADSAAENTKKQEPAGEDGEEDFELPPEWQ